MGMNNNQRICPEKMPERHSDKSTGRNEMDLCVMEFYSSARPESPIGDISFK